MKTVVLSLLFALLAVTVVGAVPPKAVVVSYPQDTPDTIVDQAKSAIRATGGTITHEYQLFKGFAATASLKALQAVSILSAEFAPIIEDDQIVNANSGTA